MVRSRQTRTTPRSGEILCLGSEFGHPSGHLFGGTREQKVGRFVEQRSRNSRHLPRIFSLAQDYFGHAMSNATMVIDLREPQIFERQIAETLDRRIDAHSAVTHVF